MTNSTAIVSDTRAGRDADLVDMVRGGLVEPLAVVFGSPRQDLAVVADGRRGGRKQNYRWFMVSVGAHGLPVAVAFYESGTSLRIPSIRLTSLAIGPGVADRDRAAVAAGLIGEVVGQWARHTADKGYGGKGYAVADVGRWDTAATDVFLAAGWRCLSPRFGWPTDRYVKFLCPATPADAG